MTKMNTLYKKTVFCLIVILISPILFAGVSYEVTDASCKGKEDGAIDLTVSGNGGPYRFEWSNGATTEDLFDIPEGDYTIQIYDKDECVYEETIAVGVEEDKPKVSIRGGGTRTVCRDKEIEINLFARAVECSECKYRWSTGSESTSITVSSSGTYSVKVTDEFGCFNEDNTEVTIERKDCDDDDDDEIDIPIVRSCDPNDIIGPVGVGKPKWVSVNDRLEYKIRFENDPDFATAPAQKVVIKDKLDDNLNYFSFRLGSFGFGDYVFDVPENSAYYASKLDVKDSLGVVVDVVAGIDITKKEAFWIFEAKDPETGLTPKTAELGFLLVNDSITHRGEGFVNYSVKPSTESKTLDTVFAMADIVFDFNESIFTPEIFNTIDAFPPQSYIMETGDEFDVIRSISVDAKDDYGFIGSGVASYDLYFSETEENSYELLAENIPIDSIYSFHGKPGENYCLYSIARDSVGNVEMKNEKDVCISMATGTRVKVSHPVSNSVLCAGSIVPIQWKSVNVEHIDIFYSLDNGTSYIELAKSIPATQQAFEWNLPKNFPTSKECLVKISSSSDNTMFDISDDVFAIHQPIPVDIMSSNDYNLCYGGIEKLSVHNDFVSCIWSTGEEKKVIEISTQGKYFVQATDSNGCISFDTVQVVERPLPINVSVTAEGSYFFCPDDSLKLKASPGYDEYIWSNSKRGEFVYVTEPGEYYASVVSKYGCSGVSDTISVDTKDTIPPVIHCPDEIHVYADDSLGYTVQSIEFDLLSIEENCSIRLIENDYNDMKTLAGEIFPIGTTEVRWGVSDAGGNIDKCSFNVHVMKPSGVLDLRDKNEVKIYPNPTDGIINLRFKGYKVEQFKIVDINGGTVYEKNSKVQRFEYINLSHLYSGTYLIIMQTNNNIVVVRKLIVLHK